MLVSVHPSSAPDASMVLGTFIFVWLDDFRYIILTSNSRSEIVVRLYNLARP
jgi:hypothetical protein